MSFLQGEKGLVEAILASYTEASHHACSERGFDNLIKANEVQKHLDTVQRTIELLRQMPGILHVVSTH
jgi:hypothetical protein